MWPVYRDVTWEFWRKRQLILFRLEAARRIEKQGAGHAVCLRSGLDGDRCPLRECRGLRGWPLPLARAGLQGSWALLPLCRLLLRVKSPLKRWQTELGAGGGAFEQQLLVSGNLCNVHLLSSKMLHHLPFMDTLWLGIQRAFFPRIKPSPPLLLWNTQWRPSSAICFRFLCY